MLLPVKCPYLSRLALVLSVFVVWPVLSAAAQQEETAGKFFTAGAFETPPFAIRDSQGNWGGLSVELWERVADDLGMQTRVRGYSDVSELRAALNTGEVDIILTIPATREYETILDITQPYFRSGYGIAVAAGDSGGFLSYFSRLDLTAILVLCAGLGGIWLIAGASLYLLERRRNPDMFGGGPLRGTGQGVWWAAVTMTTVGYGDKAPMTLGGRLVAVVWMFASIILISSFTASISAALTTEKIMGKVRGPQDLYQVRVGSLGDSQPLEWLARQGITAASYDGARSGLEAIANNEIDAFLFDVAVLRDMSSKEFPGRVTVLPQTLEHYYLGMGVANGSEHREAIDRTILGVTESEEWRQLLLEYGLEEK